MKTREELCEYCKETTTHALEFISESDPKISSAFAYSPLIYFSTTCRICAKVKTSHMSKELWNNMKLDSSNHFGE